MKDLDICRGRLYASKWSLTDFNEESETALMEAVASGEDFDTGWWGCSKEINYCRISRENGFLFVQVSAHMDDLWDGDDLIYDALWEEAHTEEELPDDIIDSIRDAAIGDGIEDYTEITQELPADASFSDLVSLIDRLESYAMAENTAMYGSLRGIVKAHWDYMQNKESEVETQNDND